MEAAEVVEGGGMEEVGPAATNERDGRERRVWDPREAFKEEVIR